MEIKAWYLSKTLWVNVMALAAIIVQIATGKDIISPELQAAILALVNTLMRLIVKQPLGLRSHKKST